MSTSAVINTSFASSVENFPVELHVTINTFLRQKVSEPLNDTKTLFNCENRLAVVFRKSQAPNNLSRKMSFRLLGCSVAQ